MAIWAQGQGLGKLQQDFARSGRQAEARIAETGGRYGLPTGIQVDHQNSTLKPGDLGSPSAQRRDSHQIILNGDGGLGLFRKTTESATEHVGGNDPVSPVCDDR